ncbi:hypothetical protein [Alloyangia pacifica]|nr:hypothetical protein [Alloyangia pacifica]
MSVTEIADELEAITAPDGVAASMRLDAPFIRKVSAPRSQSA